MDELIKIVLAGLDNAGKTSILTALDKKYDFSQDIVSLTPTIRVEYQAMMFLKKSIIWWDMGGQKQFRELYQEKQDLYFAGTDLLIYIIDIQDRDRFDLSLDYLSMILSHFRENEMDVPMIVSFHKYDPDIRNFPEINSDIMYLKQKIMSDHSSFKILFQESSIFDIISIVQLISYGLSIFDEQFYHLSKLLENYVDLLNCKSLILFDKNGVIISEFYNERIETEIYIELIESIKEHLFLLKRMQEESYEAEYDFSSLGGELMSYLHRVTYDDHSFFISVVIKEESKGHFLEKFSDFLLDLEKILKILLA